MEALRWQFAQGFVLAFLLIYFLLSKACRLGLVDRPGARKHHGRSVPLIGGLAIFVAYLLMTGPLGHWTPAKLFFLLGGGLLVVTGGLDDYFDFPAWPRMIAQIAASLCLVAAGVVLHDLGSLAPGGGLLVLGWLAVPFTVFATVGMINAANMIDGADGLSGSLFLVSIAALGVLAVAAERFYDTRQLVILGACIAAFLMFNARSPMRRAATAFLGDAGSMFLGFVLAWFLIDFSQGPHRAMPPASALWLVALPLVDTVYAIVRRLASGQSPFTPDRRHLHHLLMRMGLSVGQTVFVLTVIATGLAAIGVVGALEHWSELALAVGFALLFLAYAGALTLAWRALDTNADPAAASAPLDQPAAGPGPAGRGHI